MYLNKLNEYKNEIDDILTWYAENVSVSEFRDYLDMLDMGADENERYEPEVLSLNRTPEKMTEHYLRIYFDKKKEDTGFIPTKEDLQENIDKNKLADTLKEEYTELFKMYLKKFISNNEAGVAKANLPGLFYEIEDDFSKNLNISKTHLSYLPITQIDDSITQEDIEAVRTNHLEYLKLSKDFFKRLQVLNTIVEDKEELLGLHNEIFKSFLDYSKVVKSSKDNNDFEEYKIYIKNFLGEEAKDDYVYGDVNSDITPVNIVTTYSFYNYVQLSPHYHSNLFLNRAFNANDTDYRLTKEWLKENNYLKEEIKEVESPKDIESPKEVAVENKVENTTNTISNDSKINDSKEWNNSISFASEKSSSVITVNTTKPKIESTIPVNKTQNPNAKEDLSLLKEHIKAIKGFENFDITVLEEKESGISVKVLFANGIEDSAVIEYIYDTKDFVEPLRTLPKTNDLSVTLYGLFASLISLSLFNKKK